MIVNCSAVETLAGQQNLHNCFKRVQGVKKSKNLPAHIRSNILLLNAPMQSAGFQSCDTPRITEQVDAILIFWQANWLPSR